jgi:predicted CoA-binding protein
VADTVLTSDDQAIARILRESRVIAIVGLSSDPRRPSHDVARYLLAQGYRIVPVNPHEREVLGQTAYPSLAAVPQPLAIDIVDLFRRSAEVGPHVDEAIARGGVRCVWMQDGVSDWAAAERAHRAGIAVVMDDCTARRHRQLLG